MDVRYTADQTRYQTMDTESLRESFLLENLFEENTLNLTYTDVDRAIIGSAVPLKLALKLQASKTSSLARVYRRLSAQMF